MSEKGNNSMILIDDGREIRDSIFAIRGQQVMVDWDLARLYGVETRVMNQAVKRNEERFPERFRFKLTQSEMDELITKCDKSEKFRHYPGLPYVYTEQGIAMLASVLRSRTAISVSIRIMDAFVEMRRRTLVALLPITQMLRDLQQKQIRDLQQKQIMDQAKNDERFALIFSELGKLETPQQGVFYDGQLWDAHALVEKLIVSATNSILLIDNWATVETLDMLAKKREHVVVTVITSAHPDRQSNSRPKISAVDVAKFNAQYPTLVVQFNKKFHDRFLILDDKELYLIGASLKDLGKKCFGFTKMDAGEMAEIKARL